MNTIVVTSTKQNIKFGYEGEDNVTKIIFPYDESWLEYGEGNFEVRILRCGDEVAYTATEVVDDRQAMTLTMTVTDIELSVRGRGEMQLCYVCPDSIKKSPIYQYTVNRSIDYKYAVDPPDGSIIASVEKSLSEIKNTTNRLSNSVISIENSINDVNSQIDNINNKISEFDEEIDSIGEVDTRVDNLETSIGNINGRINTAEGNINENTESISDLNESVTELENRKVTDLETSGGKSDSGKYLTVGTDGKIKATSLTIPPTITVDDSLSTTSKNPVQNKVIKTELNNINSNIETCNTEISKLNGSLNAEADSIYNCNKNVRYTLTSGFIDANGVIRNPTGDVEEVYTNKIPVSGGDVYNINITWAESNQQWVAVVKYDSEEKFIERTVIYRDTGNSFSKTYTVPSGTSYIILAFRTYGEATLTINEAWTELTEKIDSAINASVINNIVVESRNIFNPTWENSAYSNNGIYVITSSSAIAGVSPNIAVTGGQSYAFSWGDNTVGEGTVYVHQFNSNGDRITYKNVPYKSHMAVITMEDNTTHIGIHIYYNSNSSSWESLVPEWFQIESGNVVTEHVSHDIFNNNLVDNRSVIMGGRMSVENIIAYNLPSNTVRSIAHRGDDVNAPQCTAPAYILARKRGFTVAENDLCLSEDGELVMWHDTTLSKLGRYLFDINGYYMYTDGTDFYWYDSENSILYTYDSTNGYTESNVDISNLTQCAGANYGVNSKYAIGLNLDVLKRLDFGAYKSDAYKGTQILTFEEWVLLCKQLGMEIYIDKKLTYTDTLLTQAANIVKRLGMSKKTSWLGLSTAQITTLRTIIDGARCGTLLHPTAELISLYSEYNTGRGFFFNGNAQDGMTEEVIQLGLNAGFDVEVWYVDVTSVSESDQFFAMRTAVSYGVTGITLDHYRVEDAFAYMLEQYSE